MSSSEMGPALMPSGGEEVRARYSEKRRREATVEAILWVRLLLLVKRINESR